MHQKQPKSPYSFVRIPAHLGPLFLLSLLLNLSLCADEAAAPAVPAPKTYLLGVLTDNYPYSFINDRGEIDGFAIELSHALEQVMHIRFRRVMGTTPEVHAKFTTGDLDAIQSLAISDERKVLYEFSKPYLSLVNSIIVRKGEKRIHSPADLNKIKVMVHHNSIGEQYMIQRGLADHITYMPSVELSLHALNDGNGDALIATRLTAISNSLRLRLGNIDHNGIPIPNLQVFYCYAVRKDDDSLRNTIDEGLAILNQNGEFTRIYQKWFGHIERGRYTTEEIMAAVSIGLGLALLISIWAVVRQGRLQAAIVRQADALRRSEERYRGLFESSLEGLMLLGPRPSFALRQINSAALKLLKIDALPLPDTPLLSLLPDEVSTRLQDALLYATTPDNSNHFELDLPFTIGSIWINGSITRIGENHLLALNDITENHHAHEQLLKSEHQLRQTQKLEAIGTLASGIAHDFNNILTAIIGNAELAAMDNEPDSPVAPHISEVLQSANRARQLVQQILTFSRRTESKREILRCTPIIAEAVNFIRATAPANIQIRHQALAHCPDIEADATQVHQVIMNLCTNALHAMRGLNGQLDVIEELVDISTEMIAVHPQLREGRFLRISIRDTGCGMPTHVLQRIFEPFFTTKPPGEGTGLGLSVVHGIIQAHQGALTVYSQPGQGTVFRIHFPITSARTGDPEQNLTHEVPKGRGERILFVDDEAPIVRIAGDLLRHLNYSPLCFTNPHEAADAFAENPGGFDLLVTDLTMPGMGGIELCRRLRQLRPDLPVVLASGFLGDAEAASAAEERIQTIVAKPLSLVSLGDAIQAELRQARAAVKPLPEPGR